MLPMQITFKDVASSPAIESHIRKRAAKLSHFYDRINSCRVVVDSPQKHKHQGKLFNVKIYITVPGKEFVVTRKASEDIYIAIRDAFDAAVRKLEEHARKRRGEVKTHNNVMHGHIIRLVQDEGYGFIEGIDGEEYYFSMTNVSYPNFAQLVIGDSVEYIAEALNDGRQAHHVIKTRNHLPVAI